MGCIDSICKISSGICHFTWKAKSKRKQLERGNITVSVKRSMHIWPIRENFGRSSSLLDSSLKGFPATQSKNVIHNLLFLLIWKACCLRNKAASFLHTKVFIKLKLMRNWALAGSPLLPQLSWSLAREHKSVCKEGREPLGSIGCLLTLLLSRQEADGCTGSCRNSAGANPGCFWF